MKKFLFIVLAASLFLSGCERDKVDVEKKVIEADPAFKETIEKRNLLRKHLASEKASYLSQERKINGQISKLKEEKRKIRKEFLLQSEKAKKQVDLKIRELKTVLVDVERKYKRKKEDVRNIERDIKEIQMLIKKEGDLALSPEEMQTWNDRLASFVEKKEKAVLERNKLESEVEITRLKIKVLE